MYYWKSDLFSLCLHGSGLKHQCGPAVSASNLRSQGCGFKSHSIPDSFQPTLHQMDHLCKSKSGLIKLSAGITSHVSEKQLTSSSNNLQTIYLRVISSSNNLQTIYLRVISSSNNLQTIYLRVISSTNNLQTIYLHVISYSSL